MLLLDYGMSCEEIAKVLYLDDDTIVQPERPELAGGFWLQRTRLRTDGGAAGRVENVGGAHLVFHRKLHREIARILAA